MYIFVGCMYAIITALVFLVVITIISTAHKKVIGFGIGSLLMALWFASAVLILILTVFH